jgi:hypothetical protein
MPPSSNYEEEIIPPGNAAHTFSNIQLPANLGGLSKAKEYLPCSTVRNWKLGMWEFAIEPPKPHSDNDLSGVDLSCRGNSSQAEPVLSPVSRKLMALAR